VAFQGGAVHDNQVISPIAFRQGLPIHHHHSEHSIVVSGTAVVQFQKATTMAVFASRDARLKLTQ
jgi:mannose-6-phosphate isomerase-like protein (cupin superfamily)